MRRPAVFLDRDGTLVEEVNYLSKIDDLQVFPFASDALALLKREGYLIVVVTNQSGIGRGIFLETAMHEIHDRIEYERGGLIDGFYFCPHLPADGCACRKPGTGMIEKASNELEIDKALSWMIGDKMLDVEAGINSGLRTILVRTGYGRSFDAGSSNQPHYIADDLLDAAKQIVGRPRSEQ